jgi:hypothetical protein
MTPAGYSGTPLSRKLGFKPGMTVIFRNAPEGYDKTLGPLPEGVVVRRRLVGTFDLIQFFATRLADLRRELPALSRALEPAGMLWVSWPKGSSSIPTDLGGNIVRDTILREHKRLVDVKVCAVDDDWSALKFMVRKRER